MTNILRYLIIFAYMTETLSATPKQVFFNGFSEPFSVLNDRLGHRPEVVQVEIPTQVFIPLDQFIGGQYLTDNLEVKDFKDQAFALVNVTDLGAYQRIDVDKLPDSMRMFIASEDPAIRFKLSIYQTMVENGWEPALVIAASDRDQNVAVYSEENKPIRLTEAKLPQAHIAFCVRVNGHLCELTKGVFSGTYPLEVAAGSLSATGNRRDIEIASKAYDVMYIRHEDDAPVVSAEDWFKWYPEAKDEYVTFSVKDEGDWLIRVTADKARNVKSVRNYLLTRFGATLRLEANSAVVNARSAKAASLIVGRGGESVAKLAKAIGIKFIQVYPQNPQRTASRK